MLTNAGDVEVWEEDVEELQHDISAFEDCKERSPIPPLILWLVNFLAVL